MQLSATTFTSHRPLSSFILFFMTVVVAASEVQTQTQQVKQRAPHPHLLLSTPELINYQGYPAETHQVITEDGFILELHRIPHGRIQGKRNVVSEDYNITRQIQRSSDVKAVLLVHGTGGSSADFVMKDPKQALGLVLADAGYDVWLANLRGNYYSRKHVRYTPKQQQFWDHTWSEIGRYDLPAMIGYVRKTTGTPKIGYIGYSLGTSTFFIMFNYRPDVADWVTGMAGLAPVAYIYHRFYPYGLLSPIFRLIERALDRTKIYEMFPLDPEAQASFASFFCGPFSITRPVCDIFNQLMFGFNSGYVDQNYLEVLHAHTPAGFGYRILIHLLQLHKHRRFQAYDYGLAQNQEKYGQTNPPKFNLSAVTVPVALYWSKKDPIANYEDLAQTASELPNVVVNQRVSLPYNHMDFLWANNAHEVVYNDVLKFLDSFY